MGINKKYRIPVIHQLDNSPSAGSFQFRHITVHIQSVSFCTGSYHFRSKLSLNSILSQIIIAIRVTVRNNHNDQIFQEVIMFALSHFPGKYHHRLFAFHLAGMNITVNIDHPFVLIDLIRSFGCLITDNHIRNRRARFRLKCCIIQNDTAAAVISNGLAILQNLFGGSRSFPLAFFSRRLQFF